GLRLVVRCRRQHSPRRASATDGAGHGARVRAPLAGDAPHTSVGRRRGDYCRLRLRRGCGREPRPARRTTQGATPPRGLSVFGPRYADVLKWLPVLRPYVAAGRGTDTEFIDAVYSITHVVYTLNDYWTYRLDPRLLPQEYEFLKADLPEAVAVRDADMLGEIMDSLKSVGLDDSDPLIREGTEFLLSHQNGDGRWGDTDDDIYDRYHATETAVNGLCDYVLRDEGLSFPEVEPMLERWAREQTH